MTDSQIVQLYWDRDERAIPATADAYGSYCFTVAHNILNSALALGIILNMAKKWLINLPMSWLGIM